MRADDNQLDRLEENLGRLLVGGVLASAAALAAGLLLYLADPASTAAATMLAAGLVVLMGTPMLRVLVSFVEYVRLRDWYFVATTVVVLGVLAATLLLAVYGE